MKTELQKYTKDEIIVTPFGVDVQTFSAKSVPDKDTSFIHIGTIKPIEEKYGIADIIDAAQLVIQQLPDKKFRFYLIGDGNDLDKYRQLIIEKGLADYFVMTGRVPFAEIAHYHNLLDIFLNVSINDSESFGVATVEAMACEKPVIVTDVGGLLEVVDHGRYGTVVPKSDPTAMANAIIHFVQSPAEAVEKGKSAREHVLKQYDWDNNLKIMIDQYERLVATKQTQKEK
jgi:glycosyltransferase involved in cell wall biosynthesis